MKTQIIRHHHWNRPRRPQARRVRAGRQGRDSQAGIHHQHPREPHGAEPPPSRCPDRDGGRHAQPVDQPLSGRSWATGCWWPIRARCAPSIRTTASPTARTPRCSPASPAPTRSCSIPSSTSARKCSATCSRSSCATTWCASAWTSSPPCASPSRAWASRFPRRVRNPSPARPAAQLRKRASRPARARRGRRCVCSTR